MFKHMLVATDGSQLSEQAVAYAISIAAPVNAQVTAIYVVQPVHAIVPAPLSETISEDFAARVEEHAKSRHGVCRANRTQGRRCRQSRHRAQGAAPQGHCRDGT